MIKRKTVKKIKEPVYSKYYIKYMFMVFILVLIVWTAVIRDKKNKIDDKMYGIMENEKEITYQANNNINLKYASNISTEDWDYYNYYSISEMYRRNFNCNSIIATWDGTILYDTVDDMIFVLCRNSQEKSVGWFYCRPSDNDKVISMYKEYLELQDNNEHDEDTVYDFRIDKAYINIKTHEYIPVKITIYEKSNIHFDMEKVYKECTFDTKQMSGYELVDNDRNNDYYIYNIRGTVHYCYPDSNILSDSMLWNFYSNNMEGEVGIRHVKNSMWGENIIIAAGYYYEYNESRENNEYIYITGIRYNFWKDYRTQIIRSVACALAVIFIVSILLSYISYKNDKTEWKILKYRTETTRVMAHDLKGPLMVISGYAQNLNENIQSNKREYYAQEIIKSVEYMNNIVSDILELSDTERTETVIVKENTDISKLIRNIEKDYRISIDNKKLNFHVKGSLKLNVDRNMFKRALDNIINNAVNYTPDGNDIFVELTDKNIIIKNTGITLSDEMCKKAFEAFVKEDKARTGQCGSGVGLTIAQNILRLHNMDCRIESNNNEVRFIICL